MNTEAKTAFGPRFYAWETDQHCPRDSRPAHFSTAKAKGQSSSMKDLRIEEPKSNLQDSKLAAHQHQGTKASEQSQREKKKEQRRRDQEQEGSTPVTAVNAVKLGEPSQKKKNKDQNHFNRTSHDISTIKCYNCQKIGHYSNNCSEPKN